MDEPSGNNQKALADAVIRNAGNVMSLPSAGMIRHYKSRFVGESDEGLWIEVVHEAIPQIEDSIAKQGQMAVSFKNAELRMNFATTPIRLDKYFRINAMTTVEAVLVKRPTHVKGIQRRAAYRVRLLVDTPLSVRIWSIAEHVQLSDPPMAAQEIKVDLRDISIGGIGILIPPAAGISQWLVPAQRLRLQLRFQSLDILLEGRLRVGPKVASSGVTHAGVAFHKLEQDVDGRKKLAALTRIVGQLQREEVRRAQMGLAS